MRARPGVAVISVISSDRKSNDGLDIYLSANQVTLYCEQRQHLAYRQRRQVGSKIVMQHDETISGWLVTFLCFCLPLESRYGISTDRLVRPYTRVILRI